MYNSCPYPDGFAFESPTLASLARDSNPICRENERKKEMEICAVAVAVAAAAPASAPAASTMVGMERKKEKKGRERNVKRMNKRVLEREEPSPA
uniref:Uncharacterized protein n=1 Tax=Vespula pensylvanica TaxID=30213 RepID=A0A834NXD9_VESPE|nr:hypothetical protein H0235_010628 [Vespula pensylvanica]